MSRGITHVFGYGLEIHKEQETPTTGLGLYSSPHPEYFLFILYFAALIV